jgi:propanol-preferring alcohol dehydrogenase
MKALIIDHVANVLDDGEPLKLLEMPVPEPGEREILIRVSACGVCHTELDEIEGRTPPPRLPVIPGHQVVGRVEANGAGAGRFRTGDRVGVGWIFSACGACDFCREGRENLCADFRAAGRDANGGYAGYMTISEDFASPVPAAFSDSEAAPLLCAGAVGLRSLRLANISAGSILGLTGFGASGHLVISMARHLYPDLTVFVFARNAGEREFAKALGAAWAGDAGEEPPEKMHAVIDTTPAWGPVVEAMGKLRPGGRLVINAIRKEEIDRDYLLKLDYPRDLWMEKEIKSAANVTRRDIAECLELAAGIPIRPEVREYNLEEANRALVELKTQKIRGAKVLRIS